MRDGLREFPLSIRLLSGILLATGTLGLGIQIFLVNVTWRNFNLRSYFLSHSLSYQEINYIRLLDRATFNCLTFVKNEMLNHAYYFPIYQSLKQDKEKLQSLRRQLENMAVRISARAEFGYKLRFFFFPYFIYQSLWLMIFASGFLLGKGKISLGLHFGYFSLIFGFLAPWIVCFAEVGFVLRDPYIVWLNNFNHLIHKISPSFSPVSPFSFWYLMRDFVHNQRLFWIGSLGRLGAIFTFALFYKFKWKHYWPK